MSSSVTHPVLKELKGYVSKLITDCSKPIKDNEPTLQEFCECFEKILAKDLIPFESLVFNLSSDCWHWLRDLGEENCGVPFLYVSSVEDVMNNPRVETNRGKVRLLIRTCLMKKCLYFPIQYLVNEEKCNFLYKASSVLGDPQLASVLTSLLLCLSTVVFELDLENAHFLDTSWHIPLISSVTFVPADCLGLSIQFIDGKAIIVDILNASVAAEKNEIEVGDIVDSINGKVVDKRCQGSLSRIVRKLVRKPTTMKIIKGKINGRPFPPMLHLWRRTELDPSIICPDLNHLEEKEEKSEPLSDISYFGSVSTGERGDLRQIRLAIQNLPQPTTSLPVTIECHHLGLKVIDIKSQEVLIENTYMDISACGFSQAPSPFFGFIARAKSEDVECRNYVCHIFKSTDVQVASNFLDSIGQGFKRTLYTV